MMMRFALTPVVALATVMTGCATSSPNEDFRNVEHAVSDRSGYRVAQDDLDEFIRDRGTSPPPSE